MEVLRRLSDTPNLVPPRLFDAAAAAVAAGQVTRPAIRERQIAAFVADPRRGRVRVRVYSHDEGISFRCGCGAAGQRACRHAAALVALVNGQALLSEDVQDPAEPLDTRSSERRRRVERGASGLFRVTPLPGTRIYGTWRVESPSEQAYDVVVRSLVAAHNGCTCPDRATNLLGTCKHIESVLHHVRTRRSREFARAERGGPPHAYIYVDFDGDERVRLQGRADGLAGRVAAATGAEALVAALDQAALVGVEVPAEVRVHVERRRALAAAGSRRSEVEAEIRRHGRAQPDFSATLYPYQIEGVAFLAGRGRALLCDDMGLGKTAQALAALTVLMRRGEVRRSLIVAPASLKHQWAREIDRFVLRSDLRVCVVGGSIEARRALYREGADVYITSYELVRTDERDLRQLGADLIVLDEAQRIKNWRAKTAATVKRLPSRFAFVLTGTPLQNRLDDLYSVVQVVDPHLFGPLWRFNEDFVEADERGRAIGYKNLDRLRERLAPVLLRRRKEEVLRDLPERIVNRHVVALTDAQRDIHDQAEGKVARLLHILKRRPLTPLEEQRLMAGFQRMRMACDAAAIVDPERAADRAPKLEELESLVDDLCVAGGHKVVIFSEWERMQALAAGVLAKKKIGHVRLHGGVPASARGALIDRFRDDPACRAFLSTDAGGVGLNLQVASHVINLDLPWNPAVLDQRIARVHRIGQASSVNVILLVSKDCFEERMEATLSAKRAVFAAAVGDDTETTALARSTLASRIATLLSGAYAADTGREPAPPAPHDPVAELQKRYGDALLQILRARDGRPVAIVAGDAAMAGAQDGTLVLPARAAEAMAVFGDASPLAGAETLFQADAGAAARRALADTAARKLHAARTLAEAGDEADAFGLACEAMRLACRALDDRGDPGADAASVLAAVHGHLLPRDLLSAAEAAALSRAGDAAQAFGSSAVSPPPGMAAGLLGEATAMVERARASAGVAARVLPHEPVSVAPN